jgi:uncharacterized protein YegL
MSDALRKAIGLLKKSFKGSGQNMIIFLTDGFPQGTDTEEAVMSIVERELSQLPNVVLYAVGLGGEVNDRLMENIATVTGGVYFKATDLGKLLNWYGELARTFTKAVHQKEKTPEEEAAAAETSSE